MLNYKTSVLIIVRSGVPVKRQSRRVSRSYACRNRWQVLRNRTLPPVPLPFQGRGNEIWKGGNKNKFELGAALKFVFRRFYTYLSVPPPLKGEGQGGGGFRSEGYLQRKLYAYAPFRERRRTPETSRSRNRQKNQKNFFAGTYFFLIGADINCEGIFRKVCRALGIGIRHPKTGTSGSADLTGTRYFRLNPYFQAAIRLAERGRIKTETANLPLKAFACAHRENRVRAESGSSSHAQTV